MKAKTFNIFDGRDHAERGADDGERNESVEETRLDAADAGPGPDASDEDRLADVEHEIREFVRNDVAYLRRPDGFSAGDAVGEAAVNKVNFLIQRVAGASLAEIDVLIDELDHLRETLHLEGQRVQRELTNYAQLSQAAMKSTRMIAENMEQWKTVMPSSAGAPRFERS